MNGLLIKWLKTGISIASRSWSVDIKAAIAKILQYFMLVSLAEGGGHNIYLCTVVVISAPPGFNLGQKKLRMALFWGTPFWFQAPSFLRSNYEGGGGEGILHRINK
jgi:hypothetical protein